MEASTNGSMNSVRRKVENKDRKLADYQLIRVIGTGTFGRVFCAMLKGKSYAIKMLKKQKIIKLDQVSNIKNEKNILAAISFPFIVNLIESFQDENNMYLVFDLVQGGEIFRLIREEKVFPNDVALFYVTEIVVVFEFLHANKIAYRDLKPENLLIDNDGHIKLTDFGFAKKIDDKSYTLCGTPEYLAPEVILGQGHNQGVDWWALGVMIYEMLSG
jgi:serine/threonine protein kinase